MNERDYTQKLHVKVNGRMWHMYTGAYKADGSTYHLQFYAINDEHAHALIQDIRETLEFHGQLIGSEDA